MVDTNSLGNEARDDAAHAPLVGFFDAWQCLDRMGLTDLLEVCVVKVDPTTDAIEDDERRNTDVRVWLESGPWDEHVTASGDVVPIASHDPKLDVGGKTFEEAIVAMCAAAVKAGYR